MAEAAELPQTLRRMNKLSLRQLVYFVELHQHGSFSRAAKALSISQPTLSQQLARLEDMLGTPLIQRGSRLLRLTDNGEALLSRLHRILPMLDDAIETLDKARPARTLRIGLPNYMSYPVVTALLTEFRQRQPDVVPYLAEMTAEEMSQLLNEGELDVGFMTSPTPAKLNGDMESVTIWKAPYYVCVSKRHRLASKDSLGAEDLRQLDFILVPRDYHRIHYDYQLNMLKSLGITPRVVQTDVSTTQSQMALASAGLGGCLLSPGTVSLPHDLILKATDPALGTHALDLFWSVANRNPLINLFRGCAVSLAA